jgi:hypothetical protein
MYRRETEFGSFLQRRQSPAMPAQNRYKISLLPRLGREAFSEKGKS